MKIKCIVVDDEPLAREGIAGYCDQVPFLELVGVCKNAIEAADLINKEEIELVFLDINMPGMSGLQLVKALKNPPSIVFTTAYREHAAEGFDVNAIDYLVKPISFERFLQGANKVYEQMLNKRSEKLVPGTAEEFFFVKCDGKFVRIYFDEILFVEGMKDYTIIYRKSEKLIVLVSLKKVEQNLNREDFIRVHKSYIVAKSKVDSLEGNQLKIGGHQVPISKSSKDAVINQIIGDKLWKGLKFVVWGKFVT